MFQLDLPVDSWLSRFPASIFCVNYESIFMYHVIWWWNYLYWICFHRCWYILLFFTLGYMCWCVMFCKLPCWGCWGSQVARNFSSLELRLSWVDCWLHCSLLHPPLDLVSLCGKLSVGLSFVCRYPLVSQLLAFFKYDGCKWVWWVWVGYVFYHI